MIPRRSFMESCISYLAGLPLVGWIFVRQKGLVGSFEPYPPDGSPLLVKTKAEPLTDNYWEVTCTYRSKHNGTP